MDIRLANGLEYRLAELAKTLTTDGETLLSQAAADYIEGCENGLKTVKGRSALIVDDSAMMRIILEEKLIRAGLFVTGEADNGIEAVNMFNEDVLYDYVFLNVTMPEMDGIDALKDFKKNHGSRIIMVTSMKSPRIVLESIKNGAHHILFRPFESTEMLEVMSWQKVFNGKKLDQYAKYLQANGFYSDREITQRNIREMIESV